MMPAALGFGETGSPATADDESPLLVGQRSAAWDGLRPGSDILSLDLDQLAHTPVVVPSMDIPVTSVTKEQSTVGHSAAAVFVITNEMIRRSGATCIPEALRMAPGVDVAQVNSNSWAIAIRGFNSAYSNKLLVMIDGRTVYNPDFAGVYWNMQDVLLEDVERIEVVRGPGGTLWGSNAVNGVINIITKNAKDTHGVYAAAGGGSQKRLLDGGRVGGRIGDDLDYRFYARSFDLGPGYDPAAPALDAWRQGRFGFRADWEPDRDKSNIVTVQGDHFVGTTDNSIIPTCPDISDRQTGENLLVRWRHVYDTDSDWSLQMYYDNFMRNDTLQTEQVRTFDVDFQYRFPFTERQQITCGAGFRNVESYFAGGDTFTVWFPPTPYWTTNYASQFVQDEIVVVEDRLNLTIGCKLEENPYTGLEYQPSIRVLRTFDQRHVAWGAVSRAVRTPTRYQEQIALTLPQMFPNVYPRVFGSHCTQSEAVIAYELGYREQTTDRFSWDIATFYNVYDNLMCTVPHMPTEPTILPLFLTNGPRAETYGVELAGNYSLSEHWRLYTQYTMFQMHVQSQPLQTVEQGNDPCHQVYLKSTWDLRDNLDFELMARYVDSLTNGAVPSYITMDLRLAWRPREHWEVAVVGQNLLQDHHWEFASNSYSSPMYATEVPRSVYGTVTWRR
jgi:iron complex outermembrane recepter protein